MRPSRARVAVARSIGLLVCVAFFAGSRLIDRQMMGEYRVVFAVVVAILLALGLAAAWVIVQGVLADLREWRADRR